MKSSACVAVFLINVWAYELIIGSADASLTRTPANTTLLLVSTQLRLNCSTDDPAGVAWRYVRPGSTSTMQLYPGSSTQYQVDMSSPYDLRANASGVDYCGAYTCYDENGAYAGVAKASAAVQVATKPECTLNNTEPRVNESVAITCSMTYCNMSVDLPMYIFVNVPNVSLLFDRKSYFNGNLPLINHTATLTMSALSLNGATIVCNSSLAGSSTICPSVIVHSPAENCTINPNSTTHSYGEAIFCSCDGYPIPTTYWTDVMNNVVSNSSMLVVTGIVGSNYTYRCYATNTIKGQNYLVYADISFTVIPATTTVTDDYSSPSTDVTNGATIITTRSNYMITDVSSSIRISEVTTDTDLMSSPSTVGPNHSYTGDTVSKTTPRSLSPSTIIIIIIIVITSAAGIVIIIIIIVCVKKQTASSARLTSVSLSGVSKPNMNAVIPFQRSLYYSERPTTFAMYQTPYYRSGVLPVGSSYGGRMMTRHHHDLMNAHHSHAKKAYNIIYR